ncbi:zinc finger protein SNAI3 [Phyllostomus hastatus]|uniref:zinc finger protein SNAI3 n=1 Tax=Phyllostomus hastatus TaxID=9423 RepID=UPI001E683A65|nr:zinc finger protein SNAI3 [Phyllostomus hastatus]XP_045674929.1 zinc finger protein SNAI3 [Phyllostomus hastatus]
MPRSFLVKTHSSHRVPNYGELETQREINGSCSACGGLVVPLLLPDSMAPPMPGDLAQPWDHISGITCISLPLPEAQKASEPLDPLDVSLMDPRAARAPSIPLKDSLNHLNLPPLLVLPTRWPPILGTDGDRAPDRLLRAEQAPYSPGGFQCTHCHKPYHTLAGLARHQQLHCHLQAQRCFTCKYCDKEYSSLGALKMHIRTHTLPCICTICGKAFSRPWLLQGHIRTHTGEKPYACSHCSRAFADRSNLRAHLQTHSDTKRYQCKSCAKTFSRMSLLSRHEESGCCPCP